MKPTKFEKFLQVMKKLANKPKEYLIILFLLTLTYNTVLVPILATFEIQAPKMVLITEEHARTIGSLLLIGTN